MAVNTDFQKGSFEKNAFKVLKGKATVLETRGLTS